ncbi:PAS domain-containing sensor histidine kinase [Parabacteroides distasonis]|uniref:histidine kinase n=1 Tax=Parabacteroides distasonis TaxID=823 RepID=A0A174PDQ0_PARDI|nr:PAS domain-containing sensor histidine kinase [Parabacteroides distasonis]MRY82814.1 two-component sensor histidine kinase [Parabacteroides distasonis]MRZ04767.1 two-component sensor histidine kinase [Parabacteroides distasonis]CUP57177.1 Sensor kinase protein RcsC [Parabacteroides distasonis]
MEDIQTQLDQCKLLLDRAEVGLWEADFVQRSYICSDYLMSIFGKKGNNLSFFEFYYIIREDFRDLITTDFLSIQSVDTYEQIFPIITPTGEKWVRSRLCERKLNNGVCVKALGILQILPNFKLKEEKISKMIDHNEMIFRKLYVNLPVGVELYDRDGYLIDLNAKDMEIFGIRSKKDVLGVNIFSNPIMPKDVIKKLKENKSVNFRLNYSFKKVDDYYNTSKVGEMDIVTKASILYDQRGEPSSYLLINLDNTEKMIAYNRISEFENVFTLVSVYAKVGYALYDLYTFEGYAIKQWYENMGEKDGTPLSQIIGIYSYIHPNDAGYINSFFEEVKQGKAHHFRREVRVKSGDGWKWICANITRNPQSVDPNKPEMICINYDITELKDSQLKRERAEELDRLKSAFLANMSHEIRTPLNAIVGFSQLLAETDDPEERHEFVEIIDSNNRMLLQLISDILDLAKIESGTMDFKFADMNVKEVINEIVTSFRIKMPDNVALIAPQDSPECQIYSDRMRLTQVISNFLNNAIKYTSEGCITLAYEIIGDEIKFSVTDTGDGMSQEIQAHIFDRFYKGNTFKQGTGLGLSICETIVNRLGGRIGVNSELGKGCTFWFTHPYSFSPNAKSPASPNPGTI